MSGDLRVERSLCHRLSDVDLTHAALSVHENVVVGLRVLAGQVLPERSLPGELGVAPGAGYLYGGRRGRLLAVDGPGLVPASMRGEIGGAREPLVALRTPVLDVGYPGAPVLGQLKRVLVQLPAELALVRAQPVLDLCELRPRLFGDFNDVEGRIDVSRDDCLVRAEDHGAGDRAAGVLVELQPPRVLLLRPLHELLGGAGPGPGRGRGAAVLLSDLPPGTLRRRRCARRSHGRVLHALQVVLRRHQELLVIALDRLQVIGAQQQLRIGRVVGLRRDLTGRTEGDRSGGFVQDAGLLRLLELHLLLRQHLLVAGVAVRRGAPRNAVEVVDHQRSRRIAASSVPDAFGLLQDPAVPLGLRSNGVLALRGRSLQGQVQRTRGRRSGQVPCLRDMVLGDPRVQRRTLYGNVPGSGCVRMLVDLVAIVAQVVESGGQERSRQRTV